MSSPASRSPPSPTSSRSVTTARWSCSTYAASDEFESARIADAVNIPLHEVWHRLDEVPAGEVWVHCAGGYRASVAASMLSAAGRKLVAIDDSFDNAEKVGLNLVGPDA